MGIVIPFEVVRQDKPETEEQTRIAQKEAIYRGLIEQEAMRKGQSFEEAYNDQMAHDNEIEKRKWQRGKAYTSYEHKLDSRTKFLQMWVDNFAPHIKDGSDTVPALK